MKKVIIFLAIVFGCVSAITAQDYVPLVREGVKWKCGMLKEPYGKVSEIELDHTYTIEFKGDTIINGLSYKNCHILYDDYQEISDNTVCGFMREDIESKKVLFLMNNNYSWSKPRTYFVYNYWDKNADEAGNMVLYDFNDIRQSAEIRWYPVSVNIDSVEIAGTFHKRHNISYEDGSKMISVIEGIGNCGDLAMGNNRYCGDLFTFLPVYVSPSMSYTYTPIFYHLEDAEGNIIYDAPNDPPGIDGIKEVTKISEDAVEVAHYDVHGRRLAKPVPGINIIRMSDGTVRKQLHRK